MRSRRGYTICLVVLDFRNFNVLPLWPAISNHESLARARNNSIGSMRSIILMYVLCGMTEDAREELEDAINRVLVFLVPPPGDLRLLPQRVVGALQRTELCRDGLLVPFDRRDAIHDRVHVQNLPRRQRAHRGWRGVDGVRVIDRYIFCAPVRRLLLPLYETKEVGLAAVEVGMLEMPWLGISLAPEHTLLEVRNLVESVHVQLAYEGRKLLVLEPSAKYLSCEPFMIEYCGGR